jgi:hypothetical protein
MTQRNQSRDINQPQLDFNPDEERLLEEYVDKDMMTYHAARLAILAERDNQTRVNPVTPPGPDNQPPQTQTPAA